MKFIGAFGFASAREKRPAVAVAEGGKGCCGWTFVRFGAAEEGRDGGLAAVVGGKIGRLG